MEFIDSDHCINKGITLVIPPLCVYAFVACVCVCWCVCQVKFMKSVHGTALVEMGDEYAVDRAITHLNSIKVFGKRLNVW